MATLKTNSPTSTLKPKKTLAASFLLLDLLKEFELAYNLSPELSAPGKKTLKTHLLKLLSSL